MEKEKKEPQTWHYGLIARWWAEFNRATPEELSFLQSIIHQSGQPALDVGCGTGRLLLPLLRAGVDVDGSDISPDMLAQCRELAERDGLSPQLFAQPMHSLNLPRSYRTIYICDSFGIGGQRWQDEEALRRCYEQLAPGGTFVMNNYLPYENADEWAFWLPENRQKLPQPWPDAGDRRPMSNGDELELRYRLQDFNPIEQRLTRQMRALLWRDGQVVAEEEYTLLESRYFRHEAQRMLADAGFGDITIRGGYSEQEATDDDVMDVFIARK